MKKIVAFFALTLMFLGMVPKANINKNQPTFKEQSFNSFNKEIDLLNTSLDSLSSQLDRI